MAIAIRAMQSSDRPALTHVFVEAYYPRLRVLCKDKLKLKRAFEHCFNPAVFLVAQEDGRVVGTLACCPGDERAMLLELKPLIRHMGLLCGIKAYLFLRRISNPMGLKPHVGYIECVATLPAENGRGIATALLGHALQALPYTEYTLTVMDTNVRAQNLYERMGFKVFDRVQEPHPKLAQCTARIHMKLLKQT